MIRFITAALLLVPYAALAQDPPPAPAEDAPAEAAPKAEPAAKEAPAAAPKKFQLKVGKRSAAKAPAGKRIRIRLGGAKAPAPAAPAAPPSNGKRVKIGKSGKNGKRAKRRKAAAAAAKAAERPPPPAAPAAPTKPVVNKAALRRAARRSSGKLLGTQADYGRKTGWGVVETLTPYEAAERRARLKGTEYEFPHLIFFPEKNVRIPPGIEHLTRELSRYAREAREVKLILVEGHADDKGKPAFNQALSEARASAVREALVTSGAPDAKVLAYGFGKTRPRSRDASENRRVVIRLIVEDVGDIEVTPATTTGRAGIIGIWGHGWTAAATGTAANAADAKGDLFRWTDLELRDEVTGATDIRTNADSVVLIRFPDLGRVALGPKTAIRLNRLEFDHATKKGTLQLELVRGELRFWVNPLRYRDCRLAVRFPGASLDAYSGDFTLVTDAKGKGHVSVDRGSVQVDVGRQNTLPVAAGKILSVGAGSGKPVARARVRAPTVIAPLRGAYLKPPAMEWDPLSDASGYVVELSEDLDFLHPIIRQQVSKPRYVPLSLPPGKTFYWRVSALDPASALGMTSQIHTFRLIVPPTASTVDAPPLGRGFGFVGASAP